MKKLIIVSIIFAVMIGGSIAEVVYTTGVFEDIYTGLKKVQTSINNNEDVNNPETVALMDETAKIWQDNKEALFCLGNHNVLRGVDEKLRSLKAMIDINYTDDAKVTVMVALGLIEAIKNDTVPNITNLF